mgnify:CR=1 FL=1
MGFFICMQNLIMKLYLYVLFIISISFIFSSTINEIKIIGNKKTKLHIIKREVLHPIPGSFDSLLAKEDRDRIYNLGLFSTVKVENIDSIYIITVNETFSVLPIPLIEYEEGKGFSYGASIILLNFRGLNEKVALGGTFGNENMYFFEYRNPWAYGNHGSLSAEIYKYSTQSAIYDYQYKNKGFEIGTGIYIGKKHRFNSIIGIQNILMNVVKNYSADYIKFPTPDYLSEYNYLFGEFKYIYDTRDIYNDPTKGERVKFFLKPKLGIKSTISRLSFYFSFNKFIQLNQMILDPIISFKTQILIKYNKQLPIFENISIGGEEYVRGYSPVTQENSFHVHNKIEGSQVLYQHIQLQHTLLSKKDYFGIETGLDIVYFVDFGTTSKNIKLFQISNIIYGYGIGLRFFISGPGVIGIDLGFNPYGTWFIHPKGGDF